MGHLSRARFPTLPATHRRYYVREGVKIGDSFPSQAPHVTGHTQAVLWREAVKIGDTFPKPVVP